MDLRNFIRDVQDFPKEGIVFKDITPLLASPSALKYTIDEWVERYRDQVDAIVGIEARGFMFGVPLATRLGLKFVPVRKPGKLPYKTVRREYDLEYGTDALEIHVDALNKGERVVIVDDLLATGGTAAATIELVEEVGAEVVESTFVIELSFLGARASRFPGRKIHSLIEYTE